MSKRLLILDKDKTLVSNAYEHYVPALLAGARENVELYKDAGWHIVIAHNVGGLAEGRRTLDDAVEEMRHCLKITRVDHGFFSDLTGEKAYYVSTANSNILRFDGYGFCKPDPGMLVLAMEYPTPWRWEDILMVGDSNIDRLAAENAGVRFMHAKEWRGAKHFYS